MKDAILFALICFKTYRTHQKSKAVGGLASYTRWTAGVPDVVMLLGAGREAWRVSDVAVDYAARRGVPFCSPE